MTIKEELQKLIEIDDSGMDSPARTISSTGNNVLMYRMFRHQYFGQFSWSNVGVSNTE